MLNGWWPASYFAYSYKSALNHLIQLSAKKEKKFNSPNVELAILKDSSPPPPSITAVSELGT